MRSLLLIIIIILSIFLFDLIKHYQINVVEFIQARYGIDTPEIQLTIKL